MVTSDFTTCCIWFGCVLVGSYKHPKPCTTIWLHLKVTTCKILSVRLMKKQMSTKITATTCTVQSDVAHEERLLHYSSMSIGGARLGVKLTHVNLFFPPPSSGSIGRFPTPCQYTTNNCKQTCLHAKDNTACKNSWQTIIHREIREAGEKLQWKVHRLARIVVFTTWHCPQNSQSLVASVISLFSRWRLRARYLRSCW